MMYTNNTTQRSIIVRKHQLDFNLPLFPYLYFNSFTTENKRKLEW